jgi:hypothetical protein
LPPFEGSLSPRRTRFVHPTTRRFFFNGRRLLDSISASAAANGVTQKSTKLQIRGFATIGRKFFFHESAR